MKNNEEFIRGIYDKAYLAKLTNNKKLRKRGYFPYVISVTAALLIIIGIFTKLFFPINHNTKDSFSKEPMAARLHQEDEIISIYAEATIIDTIITTEGCNFTVTINKESTSIQDDTLNLNIDTYTLNRCLNESLSPGDVVSLWLTPTTDVQLPYDVLSISKLKK